MLASRDATWRARLLLAWALGSGPTHTPFPANPNPNALTSLGSSPVGCHWPRWLCNAAKRGSILVNQLTGLAAIPPKLEGALANGHLRRHNCSRLQVVAGFVLRAGRTRQLARWNQPSACPALGIQLGGGEAPVISSTSQPTSWARAAPTLLRPPIAFPNCLRGRAAVFSTVGLLDWGSRRPNQSVWRVKITARAEASARQYGTAECSSARGIPNLHAPGHPAL